MPRARFSGEVVMMGKASDSYHPHLMAATGG
jgi:hypothetical protein